MLLKIIEEFNCTTAAKKRVYHREYEKEFVKNFIEENQANGASRLMYICGHPGTGKTSTLLELIQEFGGIVNEESEDESSAKEHSSSSGGSGSEDEGEAEKKSFCVLKFNGMAHHSVLHFVASLFLDAEQIFTKSGPYRAANAQKTALSFDMF